MARINIEDSLYKEDGFLSLVEKTGNRYTALGMVVSAFTLAQKHWIKHKAIPLSEWPESLNLLIETKLVVQKDDMIYVKGSTEAFAWLERNSNAGKVLSEKKLDQLKKARAKKAESLNLDRTTSEPALNLSEPALNLSEVLTLTPTLSLNTTTAVVVGDEQKFEETKTSKPKNSTEAFNDRFLHQEYFEILKTWDLDFPTFKNNIGKIKERFSTTEKFTEFLKSVCSNKTYKDMKSKNDRAGCDRYLSRTLKSEMGLK